MDNEFLKFAMENGKIKDIREAFKEYPVEEEWHQGRIENILQVQEESEDYYIYNIGDIVFVNEYTYDE